MDKDNYGEVINSENTYKQIAGSLIHGNPVLIGWTDEEFTHYDILFTYKVYKERDNYIQYGIKEHDLFVSIIGKSSFGFSIDSLKHGSYISEKLYVDGSITVSKLTDLINNIIRLLNYLYEQQ